MNFPHSLPPVQEVHHKIAELEILAIKQANQQQNHHHTSQNDNLMNKQHQMKSIIITNKVNNNSTNTIKPIYVETKTIAEESNTKNPLPTNPSDYWIFTDKLSNYC